MKFRFEGSLLRIYLRLDNVAFSLRNRRRWPWAQKSRAFVDVRYVGLFPMFTTNFLLVAGFFPHLQPDEPFRDRVVLSHGHGHAVQD